MGEFYTYKGNIYFLRSEGKMKNPETREWEDAFIYSPVSDFKIMSVDYIREKNDFLKKFKKLYSLEDLENVI